MIHKTEEKIITVTGDWSVNEIQQYKNEGWTSYVRYKCEYEGQTIDTFYITYTGEEYNAWFTNYTSGKFLIDELIRVKEWNISVDEAVEEEFINPTSEIAEEIIEQEATE